MSPSTPSPRAASRKLVSSFRCLSMKKMEELDSDTEQLQQPNDSPSQDLETAYVAHICLTSEALHRQYTQLRQNISCQPENPTCYNHCVQQYQQFEVLLQRFIENEPFEKGSRVDKYARSRNSLSKLLQVPKVHVEVKSDLDGFTIKMRDGRHVKCVHNSPQGGHLPDYAPHPAIVLKMEYGSGLLLSIIVLEMPSVLLMAAICNVYIATPTMYQVLKEMVEKMGYTVDNEEECISFDLRPLGAINIAVRCKVPIQVNRNLAHSDGIKIIESPKMASLGLTSDYLLFTELDRLIFKGYQIKRAKR